jgi:hypothetical protein
MSQAGTKNQVTNPNMPFHLGFQAHMISGPWCWSFVAEYAQYAAGICDIWALGLKGSELLYHSSDTWIPLPHFKYIMVFSVWQVHKHNIY